MRPSTFSGRACGAKEARPTLTPAPSAAAAGAGLSQMKPQLWCAVCAGGWVWGRDGAGDVHPQPENFAPDPAHLSPWHR
jgi:hypothetical protein